MSEEPRMRSFIPAWYYRAVRVKALLELAKAKGYSDEDIAKIRQMLVGPREPVLVSLDELYGEEEKPV